MEINSKIREDLIQFYLELITPERENLFYKIIQERTKYITVVLENFYQPHNASAVLRSCDCFGVNDVHIIENENKYSVNPDISLGSDKWVNISRYNKSDQNTQICFEELRKKGYKIVATSPHKDSKDIEEYNICDGKFALVFGTELEGLSDFALKNADENIKIPMYGFTESFNVSVSVALALYKLTSDLRKSDIYWKLTEEERQITLLQWLRRSVKKYEILEKKFLRKYRE